VTACTGSFAPDDAVEIAGPDGKVFAKGLVRVPGDRSAQWMGRRSDQLPEDLSPVVVHCDDLVLVR
jgi:glutamate 5-kinase